MFKRLCRWEEPEAPPCLSPTRPPGSPPRPALPKEQVGDDQHVVFEAKVKLLSFFQVVSILPPEQRPLLAWLRNLPDPVVEQVLSIVFLPDYNLEWLLEL